MTQTFFIREKKEKNYTVIDNTILKDPRVSWKAKGLFVYLLSLPEDWRIYLSELEQHAKDGKDSLRAAIKELAALGYIRQERQKNERGQFDGWRYEVIENPQDVKDQEPKKPKSENPQSEKPKSENPQLLNTNNNQILIKPNTETPAATPEPDTAPKKEAKHKHGTQANVLLTDTELQKLNEEYTSLKTTAAIEYLSLYKAEKNYKTKSDYLTLKRWVFKALDEQAQRRGSRPPQMTNDIYTGNGSDW
jgi:hypothetical protein